MITKMVNYEKECEEKERMSNEGSPTKDNTAIRLEESHSPRSREPDQAEEFANKVFNPDEFMAFEDSVKNICLLTNKQSKFEKRRDDGSRRAYDANRTRNKWISNTNYNSDEE